MSATGSRSRRRSVFCLPDLGTIDILVNNAGFSSHPTFARTTPESWDHEVNGNLNSAYYCAHAVLDGMKAKGGGSIIAIGSVNGLGALGDPAYSAAKAGMISLTKSLAVEYGRFNIRSNIVLPGTVRTPLWKIRAAKDPTVLETLRKWYPLGRIVDPEDVAKAVAFLASDAAAAITGVALPVDCGLTAGNIVMARELTTGELLTMDRLRIGVIGLGWFGEIHCETIAGIPNLELAALCTRRPDRLAEQAAKFGVKKTYTDYRDMLADKDIDAVSIVTMWDQHTEPAIAALQAGKHVFLEKPMASTVADCNKIIAAAKKREGHLADRPHLPLQPALPDGKAGDRRRPHRQDRGAAVTPQHSRRLDADHPREDRPHRRRCDP